MGDSPHRSLPLANSLNAREKGLEATVTVEYASRQQAKDQTVLAIKKGKSKPGARDKNLGPVRVLSNPVRSIGEIEIDLPEAGTIHAELQDLGGRKLATLFNGEHSGTKQRISVDLQNFPSGLYFCEVYVAGQRYHRLITISR